MIYQTKERAVAAADTLNRELGYPRARAVYTRRGWTVIRDYRFGVSG